MSIRDTNEMNTLKTGEMNALNTGKMNIFVTSLDPSLKSSISYLIFLLK